MKLIQSRIMLLLILAVFILPLVLAWLLFTGSIDLATGKTRNQGQLLIPTVPLDWSDVHIADNGSKDHPFTGYWVILYPLTSPCTESCQNQLAGLRQVHLATGRDRDRIVVALLMDTNHPRPLPADLLEIYPHFRLISQPAASFSRALQSAVRKSSDRNESADIFLVDPLGNMMMTYNGDDSPNKLRQDLKRLLNFSKLDKRS